MSTGYKIIILLILALLIWFIGIPLAKWKMKREVNYHLDYKSQVEETVREMVKPECLKEN